MAGRGYAPKPTAERRRANKPIRGEWRAVPGIGWQHGETPLCPDGLLEPSREAWRTWMASWFGSHWTPDDIPGLRQVVRLYDQVERGEFQRASELRLQMDNYGITPKGQQDRRWAPPKPVEEAPAESPAVSGTYRHLRAVGDG